jgi:hypothetical protein
MILRPVYGAAPPFGNGKELLEAGQHSLKHEGASSLELKEELTRGKRLAKNNSLAKAPAGIYNRILGFLGKTRRETAWRMGKW